MGDDLTGKNSDRKLAKVWKNDVGWKDGTRLTKQGDKLNVHTHK